MPRIDGHGDLDMGFDWSMVKILCNVSATLPDFPTNVPQQVNEPNVQAGALSGTTNGHFTTNQTSPVFALNNHGIIPPSAWNSPSLVKISAGPHLSQQDTWIVNLRKMLHQRNQPKKCLKIRIESLKLLESGGAVELNNFRILNNGMWEAADWCGGVWSWHFSWRQLWLQWEIPIVQQLEEASEGWEPKVGGKDGWVWKNNAAKTFIVKEVLMGPRIETGFSSGQLVTPQRLACMGFKYAGDYKQFLWTPIFSAFYKLQKVSSKRGKAATNPTSQQEENLLTDGNPLKPMVHINDSVVQGICTPWHDALVVKRLGKNIGFHTLRDKYFLDYKCATYCDDQLVEVRKIDVVVQWLLYTVPRANYSLQDTFSSQRWSVYGLDLSNNHNCFFFFAFQRHDPGKSMYSA
ncbi:hypothetical protein JHK85_009910 [Glycine max]|nr:hypothetical protein JHK85_009910 [Glycine max]